MIGLLFDYASPSAFESSRERSILGIAADRTRPVRFHGTVRRNIPMLRFALRALGELIWSDDSWLTDDEVLAGVLDPVITVHPDRLVLEAFSQDQSAYGALFIDRELFDTEGMVQHGTTNIDFSAFLWGALGEMRSSRETWLRIGAEGFEVATAGAGGRFEKKVDLPEEWVRGFLEVSRAMAMPGTRLTCVPVDLLSAIRFIRYTKAKVSPRALRYEFAPGEDVRLVLEPWEHVVPLVGATHGYTEFRTIRTWGRRRLSLIEPLLPFASEVEIWLKGRALPSFYSVKLPGMRLVLGLSGWTRRSWTGISSDLYTGVQPGDEEIEAALNELQASYLLKPSGDNKARTWAACERLCRRGRAMFDIEKRAFRYRELFSTPINEADFYPADGRSENARRLVDAAAVHLDVCTTRETRKQRRLSTPEGAVDREIIHRDMVFAGKVGSEKTEVVLDDRQKIIFGKCTCAQFAEHLLNEGPCEHMLALYLAGSGKIIDQPVSSPKEAPSGADEDVDSGEEDEDDGFK